MIKVAPSPTRVRVAPANVADVPTIVAKALAFNRATPYRHLIQFDEARLTQVAELLIVSERSEIFLASRHGQVIGMLAAVISEHPFSGETIATEMVWWVDPGKRGGRAALQLLRRAQAWARLHGATTFQMVAPDDRTGQFYERLKFTRVETLYQRRIS